MWFQRNKRPHVGRDLGRHSLVFYNLQPQKGGEEQIKLALQMRDKVVRTRHIH